MFGPFNRRFAYQFQGADQGDWTPPWLQDDRPGPRHWHRHHHWHGPQHEGWREELHGRDRMDPRFFFMKRRGAFGPKGPFGPHGPFGHHERHRFFGRGDVKYALLELLRERPMHGYEMIKALEEKSGGFYTPSAGTIYPTLQLLEDRGLVTVSEAEGKKVYSITDEGRAFLAEQQKNTEEFAGPPWERGFRDYRDFRGNPEIQALKEEAAEVARLFAIAARSSFGQPEQLARLRIIIESTRKDLTELIYGTESTETGQAPEGDQA
jgi:DNA-binding PadR family transcriptional regulator